MSGEAGDSPDDADAVFSEALTSLKRRGSNLLVVGAVTGDTSANACRRMLGDSDAVDRHRLLVFTDADGRCATERVPGVGTVHPGESVTLIDNAAASRSAVVSGPPPGRARSAQATDGPSVPGTGHDGVARQEVDATNLAELGTAITEAIDAIEADADGLGAAELRVCLDSLLPLLEANGREPVFRFLHVLTSRIREERAMAHFHLPVDPSAEEVHVLAPLFDAIVELRTENGTDQQRWHVQDADVTTDWLTV